jgi:hypothetical protein
MGPTGAVALDRLVAGATAGAPRLTTWMRFTPSAHSAEASEIDVCEVVDRAGAVARSFGAAVGRRSCLMANPSTPTMTMTMPVDRIAFRTNRLVILFLRCAE